MSEIFPVGTVCIGQNHVVDVEFNDMECTITEPLSLQDWWNDDGTQGTDYCYAVEWANGECQLCMPANLRKKHPPRSAKSIMREAILKAKQPVMEPA